MALQMMALMIIGTTVISPSSAFMSTSCPIHQDGVASVASVRECCPLSMSPRDARHELGSGILMMAKAARIKKSYNVPGYVKGDYDQIRTVFRTHSVDGLMTCKAFLDSKYLRFWPGRQCDVVAIWSEITDVDESFGACMTLSLLPSLLLHLDDVADQTVLEMEQERLAWELEEIKHNFLENYFETASRGRKLHFTDFISWESVQAEIWYNKRGLTEVVIADIWESDAGCISRGVDKETFVRIFKTICGVTCLS